MQKRNSKRTYHRSIIQMLAAALAAILVLNTAGVAYAKEALIPQISGYPLPVSDNVREHRSDDTTHVTAKGFENPGDKRLTGLVLKDLDEPVPGNPFDKLATITSKEGTTWDIPVFWIGDDGKTADIPEEGKSYMPLLVFFVPDGFTGDGILTLPSFLSNLFLLSGGVLTITDYDHGITYITGNVAEISAFMDNDSAAGSDNGKYENGDSVSDQKSQASPENPNAGKEGDHSENPGDEDANQPEDPDDGKENDEPKNPDDEQPANPDDEKTGDEPDDPDDGETGDEPDNPDDEQPVDEPEEPDPYVIFADKYREGKYQQTIPWAEELDALGGMENVDFVRLIRECGYNLTSRLSYDARNAFEDPEKTEELMELLYNARKTVENEILEQADPYLKAHVDSKLILKSNHDSLLAIVHTLIDDIIPQTVLVLRENFPAFSNAPDEAFSKNLGLAIVSGLNSVGEAANSYEQTNDFHILMRIFPETPTQSKDKKGANIYDLTDNSKELKDFEDTILHEMMHIFMSDYNRNGLDFFTKIAKTENKTYIVPGFGELTSSQLKDLRKTLEYPNWFAEGIASLCGSIFRTNSNTYFKMMRPGDGTPYSATGIYNFIQKNDVTLDGTYSGMFSDLYNDYVFGSLTVMYMGEMYARKTSGESTVHSDESGKKTIDTICIRNGLSDILERMHNGETLDSIFADISDGKYKDTREFCEKCFESEGPNEDILSFMADVLNYVDALNTENGSYISASILLPFTENFYDLIDETKSAETDIYVIQDGMDFTKSTVPEEIASKTGGKSDPSPIFSDSEDEPLSGAIMSSVKDPLPNENTVSEVNGQPDPDEQAYDIAGQEASEPACQEDAADQEAENQGDSCVTETEQCEDSSESGAEVVEGSCEGEEGECEQSCESDAGECEQTCEPDAGECEQSCEPDAGECEQSYEPDAGECEQTCEPDAA